MFFTFYTPQFNLQKNPLIMLMQAVICNCQYFFSKRCDFQRKCKYVNLLDFNVKP